MKFSTIIKDIVYKLLWVIYKKMLSMHVEFPTYFYKEKNLLKIPPQNIWLAVKRN